MNDPGLVLVTGGLGFIGRHLVQLLAAKGRRVRVLDTSSPGERLNGDTEVITGSILDEAVLAGAMKDVSVVYHLAAIPHLWQKDPDNFNRVNVDGTRKVVQASLATNIKKFIYTSSETVLRSWNSNNRQPVDESQPLPLPEDLPGPYSRSKLRAEQEVMKAVDQGLPAVVVYPTVPIGAGDHNLTPPTRMIRGFIEGKNPAYLECNLNMIPVKAVAQGHLAAEQKGKIGERYILGQQNLKMSEFLELLQKVSGAKMPGKKIPYTAALLSARIMEKIARVNGKIPQASIEGVRLAKANLIFNTEKAARELGLKPQSLAQAIAESVSWIRENG